MAKYLFCTYQPAGQMFFIKWTYLSMQHKWYDLKWSISLLLSSNLTCNMPFMNIAIILLKTSVKIYKLIPHLYTLVICSADFAGQVTMSAEQIFRTSPTGVLILYAFPYLIKYTCNIQKHSMYRTYLLE